MAWLLVPFVVGLIADQATKQWARGLQVVIDEVWVVPGWLSFVHAQNTGAAFSTLPGFRWLFLGFTCLAVVVLMHLALAQPRSARAVPAVLGLILSGAVGNAMDRVRLGHVTDFIKVTVGHDGLAEAMVSLVGTRVWPIFNVADIALVVGVGLFSLHYVFEDDEAADAPPEPGPP